MNHYQITLTNLKMLKKVISGFLIRLEKKCPLGLFKSISNTAPLTIDQDSMQIKRI